MLSFLSNLREKHDLKTLIFYSSWSLTLTSGLSYVLGYLRDAVLTSKFGLTGNLDIYKASFVLPEMLQNILVVAALSAGFVPIFSKNYDQKKEAGALYAHQILSWGTVLLLGSIILAIIFMPHIAPFFVEGFTGEKMEQYISLTRFLLITTFIFGISTILGQILISLKEFFWYGLSPVLNNLGVIFGIFYLLPSFGLMGLILGAMIGSLLHLIIRYIVVKRKKIKFQLMPNFGLSKEIKETFLLAYPKIPQYILAQIMTAKFVSISTKFPEGTTTAHDLAKNLQSMPVSFLGIAISFAMFTSLSHDAGKGNFEKFKKDFKKNRFKALFYTTFAAGFMAIFSTFIVQTLFGRGDFGAESVSLLAGMLMVYCISIPLESLLHIYHRAFYALKNTLIPSTMHSLTIILTIIGAYLLSDSIGIYCIPVSFASGLALHILVLSTVFPILLKKREASASLAQ